MKKNIYDVFKPGDRVYRKYIDIDGSNSRYEGIILSLTKDSMEVFWDRVNGKYKPTGFTKCSMEEIFDGSSGYTPIKHRHRFPW
ncbi:MAG: hypothetical protein DRN12_06255 [Thermoplasmata archaeon]|nr:MAG: hypothetical protein DRN12_06255 [Thermoplasmata archaeon]